MTVKEILKREARSLGRPVKLIDSARLDRKVVVVLYESTIEVPDMKIYREVRYVLWVGDGHNTSGVVSSNYDQ